MKKTLSRIRLKKDGQIPPIADQGELARVAGIIADAECVHNTAFLAFTGDKRFLFSESGQSFIMFGVKGRAWISVGPAIGRSDEVADLEVRFIKRARQMRAFPSFYGVKASDALRLEKAGLVAEKLGEKATLNLDNYTFSGRGKRDIRSARNKAIEAGCRFEVMNADRAREFLLQLKAISDNWLSSNSVVEKTFSLGRFNENYLQFFQTAIVFKDDEPTAFANLWVKNSAVVIDMMRYKSPAQTGLMDYLFMEVILWAQKNQYKTFDMGASPLAGLADQPNPSAVSKLGGLVFSKGGKFYNFTGLRNYKNKFDPEWEPLHICATSSLRAGASAMAVASLTGTGLRKKLSLTKAKPQK